MSTERFSNAEDLVTGDTLANGATVEDVDYTDASPFGYVVVTTNHADGTIETLQFARSARVELETNS